MNVSVVNQFKSFSIFFLCFKFVSLLMINNLKTNRLFKVCDENERMSYEDFLEWTRGQLRFFLMKREKTTTGNKKDLAARALVAFETKDPVVMHSEKGNSESNMATTRCCQVHTNQIFEL